VERVPWQSVVGYRHFKESSAFVFVAEEMKPAVSTETFILIYQAMISKIGLMKIFQYCLVMHFKTLSGPFV
jgi:hypothetical protein